MREYMRPLLQVAEKRNRANAFLWPLDILREHFHPRTEDGHATFEQLLASQVHSA